MKDPFTPARGMLQMVVPGNLISTNADQFRTGASSAIEAQSGVSRDWAGIEIDLTAAQMVDSAGLNALISLIRALKHDGKRVLIHVRNPHVYRVCMFTRLDSLAEIVRS
ncbi:MAG TPA: STAS domain-containing protein [Bryobacteraceae bacterium]|jgi:anti-anti-sigma regulatory factor|nr:STAS domain-containing protein [Bryobacteraceae bacterium]